jgi:probable rRNA maturation factor
VSTPKIQLFNHQRGHRVAKRWLEKIAVAALPSCLAAAKSDHPPLLSLEEIEVSIVSDSKISKVHADFLGDDSPTDVITFHHGEILISADTALRQGLDHHQSMDQELALYLVHGLLHLAGWEDEDPEEQAAMHRLQEKILASAIASL